MKAQNADKDVTRKDDISTPPTEATYLSSKGCAKSQGKLDDEGSMRNEGGRSACSNGSKAKVQLGEAGQSGSAETSLSAEDRSRGSPPAQSAGESSVSESHASKSDCGGRAARAHKPRSRSETTLTSYEDLEVSLKEGGNAADARKVSVGDEAKIASATAPESSPAGSRTGQVPPPDPSLSVSSTPFDSRPGPPKEITTTNGTPSGRSCFTQTGTASPSTSKSNRQVSSLRRGKWTVEEEAYVARVIQDFNSGFLDAPAGTTLRTYLSEKLQCDPMRITKKFTGDACIGKRVFHPAVRSPSNAASIDKAQVSTMFETWMRFAERRTTAVLTIFVVLIFVSY